MPKPLLCSDDSSQLSLSLDDSAAKLTVRAKLNGYKSYRAWESLGAESISKPIHLEAGRRYYLEVLHKDGDGGDHVSVAWRKVGEPAPMNGDPPIGAEFLECPAE